MGDAPKSTLPGVQILSQAFRSKDLGEPLTRVGFLFVAYILTHVAVSAARVPCVRADPRPRSDGRPGGVSRLPPRGTRHPLRTRATPVPRHRADRPRDDARARAIHAVGRARYPLGGPRPPHGHGFGTAGPRRALVWNRVRVQTDSVAVGTLPAPVVLAPAPDRHAAGAPPLRRRRGRRPSPGYRPLPRVGSVRVGRGDVRAAHDASSPDRPPAFDPRGLRVRVCLEGFLRRGRGRPPGDPHPRIPFPLRAARVHVLDLPRPGLVRLVPDAPELCGLLGTVPPDRAVDMVV